MAWLCAMSRRRWPWPARRPTSSSAARTPSRAASTRAPSSILRPLALPRRAARQRGRGRPGAPHARRREPVRERPRRGAARVPQAARAAPRLPLRSAARSAARRRLLQRRRQGRGEPRSPCIEAKRARDATTSWRRASGTRPSACARSRRASSRYEKHSYAVELHPLRRGAVPERRSAARGWAFFGAEAALGAIVAGRVRDQLRALRHRSHQRRCLDPPTSGDTTGAAHNCMNIDHSEENLSRNLLRLQVVSGGALLRGRDLGRHRRPAELPPGGLVR